MGALSESHAMDLEMNMTGYDSDCSVMSFHSCFSDPGSEDKAVPSASSELATKLRECEEGRIDRIEKPANTAKRLTPPSSRREQAIRTSSRRSQSAEMSRSQPSKPNANKTSHYAWTKEVLDSIISGSARGVSRGTAAGIKCSPVFVVAGSCPNRLCGMQAVLYVCPDNGGAWAAEGGDPRLDFWWIKPQKANPRTLQKETMHFNMTGPYKNDPGRSKEVYDTLVEKFVEGRDGNFTFGLDSVSGRAYIAQDCPGRPLEKMLLYLIWQEEWSSPFARKKFIKGKLCYQKEKEGSIIQNEFYARRYEIMDGRVRISSSNEERYHSIMPPESFQN